MKCPTCKGTGDSNGNHEREWIKCRTCNGSGEVDEPIPSDLELAPETPEAG